MGQEDSSGLKSDVTGILMANSSFYRESPDDEGLYLLDPVTIGALAYKIIEFAANVFGATLPLIAAGRWAYKKYLRGKAAPAEPLRAGEQVAPKAMIQVELRVSLERLKSNAQHPDIRRGLADDVRMILEYHGWPTAEAEADAGRIVTTLVDGDGL